MDKVTAGLLGAVAGLATMGSAQAATAPAANPAQAPAASYADLLAPIPNPVELLRADNAARAQAASGENADGVQLAEWYGREYGEDYHHHHHHHHHHRYYGRNEHHHHHHHHHNSSWVGVPGVGGVVVRRD